MGDHTLISIIQEVADVSIMTAKLCYECVTHLYRENMNSLVLCSYGLIRTLNYGSKALRWSEEVMQN